MQRFIFLVKSGTHIWLNNPVELSVEPFLTHAITRLSDQISVVNSYFYAQLPTVVSVVPNTETSNQLIMPLATKIIWPLIVCSLKSKVQLSAHQLKDI